MNIAKLQALADKYAAKLGLKDKIRVKEAEGGCLKDITSHAHCHIHGEERGWVCFKSFKVAKTDYWFKTYGRRYWKWLIAHEITHLKVQDHNSPYFKRWMARLGFEVEKEQAVAAGLIRHRHKWGITRIIGGEPCRMCQLCGTEQTGTIKWKSKR